MTGSAVPAIIVVAVSNAFNAWKAGVRSVIRLGDNAQGATQGHMLGRMAAALDAEMLIMPNSA